MKFLLITQREIRARSRKPAIYWLRVAAGLIGILICVPQFYFAAGGAAAAAQTGRGVFNGVTAVAFFLCCGAGLLTADAISSESRNGTLGLLMLTRVHRLDVVLGKLSSGLVTSLSVVVALIPLLMVPLLAGGVTGGEAFRRTGALVLSLFVFLAAGLLASSAQESLAKATQCAVALIAAISLFPLIFLKFPVDHFLASFSPVTAFWSSSEPVYRAGGARFYWASLVGLPLVECVLIAVSVLTLRSRLQQPEEPPAEIVQEDPPAPEIVPEQLRWHAASQHLTPVEWIVARERAVRRSLWTGAIFIHFAQTAGYVAARSFGAMTMAYVTEFLLLTTGSIFLAWAVSRFFVEARRTGQIELLLTTPYPASRIIIDQWNALKRLLVWPLLVMITPSLLRGLIWRPLIPSSLPALGPPVGLRLIIPVSVVQTMYTVCLVLALCWLAMFYASKARTQTSAVICSVVLGPTVVQLMSFAGSATSMLGFGFADPGFGSPGPLLGILYCLCVCRFVRVRLAESFPGNSVSWADMFWVHSEK